MTDPLRTAIAAAMQHQSLTVSETARRSGVPRTTLSAYLAGRRGLSDSNVVRLLAALGLVVTAETAIKPPRE